MDVRENLLSLREGFFDLVAAIYQKIATNYGFPENPGMPLIPRPIYGWTVPTYADRLPLRKVQFPPQEFPRNYLEVLLGRIPAPTKIPRVFYESKTEGYYSFYVENFKNLFFLPNELSEFIQIRCGVCVDLQFLELCHTVLFALLVYYTYAMSLRVCLAWFININPYVFPCTMLSAITDWVEDASLGIIPNIGGLSVVNPLIQTLIGKMADSLNHLAFTMPYLPSEGVIGAVMVDGQVKQVLKFRYLPILWYKYPIPNDLRYYWFAERPDILAYMQRSYEQLDIQFLPDEALTDLSSLGPGILWKSVEDLCTLSDFLN